MKCRASGSAAMPAASVPSDPGDPPRGRMRLRRGYAPGSPVMSRRYGSVPSTRANGPPISASWMVSRACSTASVNRPASSGTGAWADPPSRPWIPPSPKPQ